MWRKIGPYSFVLDPVNGECMCHEPWAVSHDEGISILMIGVADGMVSGTVADSESKMGGLTVTACIRTQFYRF